MEKKRIGLKSDHIYELLAIKLYQLAYFTIVKIIKLNLK